MQSCSPKKTSHLNRLEAESIHIIREVMAELERPYILFSGGKDSVLLTHLAMKAFYPAKLPFPLMHIDTGHNFPEVLAFRDEFVRKFDLNLEVRFVQDSIDKGRVRLRDPYESRNKYQTVTLLDAISELKIDALFGGARRDEEKARAKERIFSFRDDFGQWDPKNQRPELWNLYNTMVHPGENIRVFPLSNWTELDVWQYILNENLEVPSIYYAHQRQVVWREGWVAVMPCNQIRADETIQCKSVRFRTVGDMTCTGAVESTASTQQEVFNEVQEARITERGATRLDDRFSEIAMEERKREGYF